MSIHPKICGRPSVYIPECEGGGGGCDLTEGAATANGTLYPPDGYDGFSEVAVNVPNSYTSGDEGKVVDGGALVGQESLTVTENGIYDTTLNNQVVVNVVYGYKSPHMFAEGDFYQTALMGEDTVTIPYYDPETQQMYDVTLPNDMNVLQWETTVEEGESQ